MEEAKCWDKGKLVTVKNDKNKQKYFVDDHLELDRPGLTWSY